MSEIRRKARLSDSPLAVPNTLVHQTVAEIQNYLYFPDPSALYVTLGAVAGNMIYGNPVWLLLVGPPGCGKTQILEMFARLPQTKIVSIIKSPAVLLSGTGKKEITKGATGGLLREIGLLGTLIMTDMAGMMKLAHEPLGEVLAAFRDIYGGRWVRPIGTDGGRSLVWGPIKDGDSFGKLTFLGAATQAIDRHHQLNAELGERWIYYRFPDSDSHGETQSALRNKNPQEANEIMRQLVLNFFVASELSMSDQKEKRDFTAQEEMRLRSMAMLSVKLRSEVPREKYTHEVIDIAEAERPQRLATVLGQLYLGLEAIGLEEFERWPLIGKVALDSTPKIRSEIIRILRRSNVTMQQLKACIRLGASSTNLIERTCEDLQIHGIVDIERCKKATTEDGNGGLTVCLSSWAAQLLGDGWNSNG